MTRISVTRSVIGEDIEVHVSSGDVKTQVEQTGLVSVLVDTVIFRVKPDRRAVDTVMPAGRERRRVSQ
jgi:hypothetical protein